MTTADLLGFASLGVAFVALAVGAAAIRRDRPFLIVRGADAAAGSRYLNVVNVGLRPVRITSIVTRTHRRRRWDRPWDLTHWAQVLDNGTETKLPYVLDPAAEIVLQIPNPEMIGLAWGPFAVVDASGRLHWPETRIRAFAKTPRTIPEEKDDTEAS